MKIISEMSNEELERRILERKEREHRIKSRIRIVLLVIIVVLIIWAVHIIRTGFRDLDTVDPSNKVEVVDFLGRG